MTTTATQAGANGERAVASSVGWSANICSCALLPAVVLVSLMGCEKFALDRRMDELCKKDGGVRVYETVTLPPEMFDQWGDPFPGWRGRNQVDRLGPDYQYSVKIEELKKGDPIEGEARLLRFVTTIHRRSDGKLMGEAVSYGRSGGDLIAYAHPTSKSCPIYASDSEWVIKSVFLRKAN